MKIFLTGGTGFIGSYVAMELVKHEHRVTILARNPDKVPELKKIEHIEIIEGDITNLTLLEKFIIGKDACILVALNYTKKTGWEVLQDDTLPTVYISDIAVRENVKHFIYISSTAVNDSLYMADASELREKFGGFNHTFYENVFELIFRLKGNYLWPAMWGRAFYVDDPLNPLLADEYGINSGRNRGWKGMGGFPLKTIRE